MVGTAPINIWASWRWFKACSKKKKKVWTILQYLPLCFWVNFYLVAAPSAIRGLQAPGAWRPGVFFTRSKNPTTRSEALLYTLVLKIRTHLLCKVASLLGFSRTPWNFLPQRFLNKRTNSKKSVYTRSHQHVCKTGAPPPGKRGECKELARSRVYTRTLLLHPLS